MKDISKLNFIDVKKNYISIQCKMKPNSIFFLVLILLSCNTTKENPMIIDTSRWVENKITLSQIVDDIEYIPMDNSVLFGIESFRIIRSKAIYAYQNNVGILKFNREGKYLNKIGTIGRGPGEYSYGGVFTVNDKTGVVYVYNFRQNKIIVYLNGGNFTYEISLKGYDNYYNAIDYFNNHLILFDFLENHNAKNNWLILDTLGKLVSNKKNSILPFDANVGVGGGTYKFENKIYYWNYYNDTIFKINPNFSWDVAFLFSQGENRWPRTKVTLEQLSKLFSPVDLFETKQFLVIPFGLNSISNTSIFDKKTLIRYLNHHENSSEFFCFNDFDNGIMFRPRSVNYYIENNREYLIGFIDVLPLKTYVSSDEFKNSVPKYPEKKKELEKLANSLKETDNPVLMMVRLKK